MAFVTEFVKGSGFKTTVVYCSDCERQGKPHSVEEVPAGPAKNWGNVPSHRRRCTVCGFTDGPWVPAELVGDY